MRSSSAEDPAAEPPATAPTRAGTVALVGLPNAGKSTLLNALVGERLSIVTAKPQTTRAVVSGIRTEGPVQAIFEDTPGLLAPRNLLQKAMAGLAGSALIHADLRLVVVDATRTPDSVTERLEEALHGLPPRPTLAALNHADRADEAGLAEWKTWADGFGWAVLPTAAVRGVGVPAVWSWVADHLPESPFLYPEDELSGESVRFFVSELVRETVFERYRQEIPYSVVCTVDEFRGSEEPVYIGVTLHVERESQKGLVVGKGGRSIRDVGVRARKKIETFLGRPVYLDLWVKVLPGWRSRTKTLARLGFPVPGDGAPQG